MKSYHFTKITSTNDLSRSLIESESEGEIIVTADEQTAGRGRMNRVWTGDFAKNMYFTYAVNHQKVDTFENMISYLAASSIFTISCFRYFAKDQIFKLKYPNDIYCFDNGSFKKISGILTEHIYAGSNPKYSIIGIGANINQDNFSDDLIAKATSLYNIGIRITTKDFINKLTSYFGKIYSMREENLFKAWKNEINIVDKEVFLISKNKKMIVKEHMRDGRLLLVNENEELIIDDGESIIYEL